MLRVDSQVFSSFDFLLPSCSIFSLFILALLPFCHNLFSSSINPPYSYRQFAMQTTHVRV